jgi:demethylmenaquinone methyltransferase/2-methoxy-6-polyprenyl-1,4-benzoquinol methylase
MRTASGLRRLGLEKVQARTFIGEIQAPLSQDLRTALSSLFEMLWGMPQPEASAEDVSEYKRLCTPGSPDFILDIPDYYAFFTYSLFQGMVSKL